MDVQQKNMKNIIFTLFICITATCSTAFADVSGTLRMEAKAFVKDSDEGRTLLMSILIINETEEEQTILTNPKEVQVLKDAKGLVSQFGLTKRSKAAGYSIIPSILPLEPVTLRPGEATRIIVNKEGNRTVDTIEDGQEIRIKYVVLEQWAERFDLAQTTETTTTIKAY